MSRPNNELSLSNMAIRLKSPTPKFFKKLRLIGLIMVGTAGAILSAPALLPAALVTAAGYFLTAGGVIAAICTTVTKNETDL